jgi:prepilin-type N-terminal cleavage/methylation domain-containing protein
VKSRTSGTSGFTLVEIMIVVAVIALLAAIAIPNIVRARTQSHKSTCIHNLRQIEDAIQTWGTENKKVSHSALTFADIRPYLKGEIICPAGGKRFSDSYYVCHSDHETINIFVKAEATCRKVPEQHVLPEDTTE